MFDVDFTMIGTASKTDLQMEKVDKRAFETEDGRFYLTVDGITALHSSPRLETAAQSRRPVFYPPGTKVRKGYLSGDPYFAEGFLDCAVRVQGYVTAYFSVGGIYRSVFEEDVRKAELMRTLQTYLRHMCDTRKTAEALHIHRNTLYYRLNQLEELMGHGGENGAEVLRLMLSFEVIGYFAAFGGR